MNKKIPFTMNKKKFYEAIMRKVSQKVKDALNENETFDDMEYDEGGWSNVEILIEALDECDTLNYELKNCVRGAYTGCRTSEDLKDYVRQIIEQLEDAVETL